jgi:2-keto-4-pentenoate hydratase
LVDARLRAVALPAYPGGRPATLTDAYAVQDAAIALWPDDVCGWKIGLVQEEHRAAYGAERIAGPIFRDQLRLADNGEAIELPVFAGGFAAVEAEFILRIGRDAPSGARAWRAEEAAELVDTLHVGVECASSPLALINDLGPAVTASDFGNNAGLIVGPAIADWRDRPWASLTGATFIVGQLAGSGAASLIPGGPFAALAFILEHCAARGRPLTSGQWISTGATTGVHAIKPGQSAQIDFGVYGQIRCTMVKALGDRAQNALAAG